MVELLLKIRYLALGCCLIVIVVGFLLLVFGELKFIFFPQIESDELYASLEMQPGTPFGVTRRYANQMKLALMRVESDRESGDKGSLFEHVAMTIGGLSNRESGPAEGGVGQRGSNLAEIEVALVPASARSLSASELESRWRKSLGEIPGVRLLTFESSLVSGGKDVNFELAHDDEARLRRIANLFKADLKKISGVSEVVDSAPLGKLEFHVELSEAGLIAGLTPQSIGQQLRAAIEGAVVERFQRGRHEVEVRVLYPESLRSSRVALEKFRVQLPNGESASLETMANVVERRSLSKITRVDGRRVVSVTADVDEDIRTPGEVIEVAKMELLPALKTQHPGLEYSLQGESKDRQDDLRSLGRNMAIAILLILVLLAGQLQSYTLPLCMLVTVPAGAAGAFYGHYLLGFDLSFVSFFEIVALTGVIINDAVVLIDFYNNLRASGLGVSDAVVAAVKRRFRPILLTTLTTSLGLLPILLEQSLQAQFIIPMAVSLACGLIFASAMQLILIPVLLKIGEDMANVWQRKIKRQKRAAR